jgi:hypothetical protein
MGPLVRVLNTKGFTPSLRNIGRILFVFQNAFWASLHTWREKKLYGKEEKSYARPTDAVIIIGHWRTGSTYLQQLLSQDSRLITPGLFQVTFPDCFRSAEKYFRPIMGRMVKKRPMDQVKMGFNDPQEDEFAVLKLTQDSPLMDIVFPSKPGYFISHYEDFNPLPEHREMWKEKLLDFCARICRDSGRMILLKNPVHSLRIPYLMEVFPGARFIHIHRHPYKVAASTMHLWKVMARDNQLKGKTYFPTLEEVAEGMEKFYSVIGRDAALLPEGRYCEVSYEELEKDPKGEIKKIYSLLGLEYTKDFEDRIRSFRESTRDFRKNSYTFGDAEEEVVFEKMKNVFEKYDYKR